MESRRRLVHKLRAKKFTLVDGNHRVSAATRAKLETWPNGWYEITKADAQTLRMLVLEANARPGLAVNVDVCGHDAGCTIEKGAGMQWAPGGGNTAYALLSRALPSAPALSRDASTDAVHGRCDAGAGAHDDAWLVSDAVTQAFLGAFGAATRAAYARDLADLAAFARRRHQPPLLLTRVDLDAYVREMLDDRGLAASTVRRRGAAVRGMYAWAVEEGLLARSPAARLRLPRAQATIPKVRLSVEDMLALSDAAEAHSRRAAVMLHLLLWHGLRISECLSIDAEDLRREEPTGGVSSAVVRVKGGVRRELALAARTGVLVVDLLAGREHGPVLRSRSGLRLHRTNATELLRTVASSALPDAQAKALHPHACRRAFATASLRAGVSIADVQRALGHRDPAMTLRYVDSTCAPAAGIAAWALRDESFEPSTSDVRKTPQTIT